MSTRIRRNRSEGQTLELVLPATSANLGPAFDAAALALKLFLKVRARIAPEFSLQARGRDSEVCGQIENHLILATYREVLQSEAKPVHPLALRIDNQIPIGKGCGSSAAARLAGIALAVEFGGLRWTTGLLILVSIPVSGGVGTVSVSEKKSSYTFEDLIECAKGRLFGPGNAQLPLPPMLMIDRIVKIADTGGQYGKGEVVAELDIKPDLWFFACHFKGDPVMPGCLPLDAMWQLLGFFLGWMKAPGRGRALGVGEVKFSGMVVPTVKKLTYHVHLKRVILRKLVLGIADGFIHADGQQIYEISGLKVGLVQDAAAVAAAS